MKKYLILVFLLELLISLGLKILNYQGDHSPETIERILRYFSEEDIRISTEYHREGFVISLFSWVIRNLFFYFIIFTSFAESLETLTDFLSKGKNWLKISLYVSIVYLIYFLINLPFSYYFGFVLEHKFGFSKMSIGFWLLTKLKTFTLILIGINFASHLACYIIKGFPIRWIFFVPAGGIILGLFITILYPYLILPLYYEVEPIPDNSLKQKIEKLASKSEINIKNIYIIKESKYSSHTNAFFTGFGSEKKIYLYDTLIEKHTEDEVVSVLGHEIGHWKYNHTTLGLCLEFVSSFLQCIFIYFIIYSLKNGKEVYVNEVYSASSLPILIFLSSLISFPLNPINSTISRFMEIQADREALFLTKDAESFISAEVKLARDNKSRLNVHPIVEIFYHSHPKTIDRIKMGEDYRKGVLKSNEREP